MFNPLKPKSYHLVSMLLSHLMMVLLSDGISAHLYLGISFHLVNRQIHVYLFVFPVFWGQNMRRITTMYHMLSWFPMARMEKIFDLTLPLCQVLCGVVLYT